MPVCKGLMERLRGGEKVICAEGYVFNFERRGYLQAGSFVPEVVLNHPQLVKEQYEEFVHAGSDVVQAFTYYATRMKIDLIGNTVDLETLNRTALKLAREVADNTGTLMCGDMCNTNIDVTDPRKAEEARASFKEQIEWSVSEGADFLVGETYSDFVEAELFLECAKKYGNDLPVVVTIAPQNNFKEGKHYTLDGVEITESMKRLEAQGADVVGVNCSYGPTNIVPLLEQIKKSGVKVPLAALPVTYRTTPAEPNFMSLTDPITGKQSFPSNMDCHLCTRDDITQFGQKCVELGVDYIGLCCGNAAHYTRALAESIGRTPPASKFSPDMSKHCVYGTDEKLDTYLTQKKKLKYAGVNVANTY